MTELSFLVRLLERIHSVPDNVAFVIGDKHFSYRELGRSIEAIRKELTPLLEKDDVCVAVHATQSIMTYAGLLAIMSLGRAYVPLNPRAPWDRNVSCLEQSGARFLLCESESSDIATRLEAIGSPARVVNTSALSLTNELRELSSPPPDGIAYLLFTSGSTGIPKGVPIRHSNLNAFLEAVVTSPHWWFAESDRFLQMFDLTFDLSIMSYALPLMLGAECHVVPDSAKGFAAVARTLRVGKVTVALMVPSALSFLERYFDEIRLPSLRLSLFCGEALQHRLAERWRPCIPNGRVFNVYGPTEATIFCSSFELLSSDTSASHLGIVSIGTPLPGTRFRIVDEQLSDIQPGGTGELVLQGDQVTDQYWRSIERSQSAFVQLSDGSRGYRTGDLVVQQSDFFYFCGRADSQVKIDGYRVELGEIEHHAREIREAKDAVVVPEQEGGRVKRLHLFIIPNSDADLSEGFGAHWRAFLAERLPAYMIPHKAHVLDEFPLNSNGKVDRKALLASVLSGDVR